MPAVPVEDSSAAAKTMEVSRPTRFASSPGDSAAKGASTGAVCTAATTAVW